MKPSLLLTCLLAFTLHAPLARAACRLEQVGQLPVSVEGGRLVVSATINGRPATLFVDTGAPATVLGGGAVSRFGLKPHASVSGLRLNGIGGEAQTQVATVSSLSFGQFRLADQPVFVVGSASGNADEDPVGLVGRDMFQDYDVDVDVPQHLIRILRPVGCAEADMAYWAKGAYSEAPLQVRRGQLDDYRTDIMLNGRGFPAILDTGAPRTTVTDGAAGMVGVTLTSQGSVAASTLGGLGPGRLPSFSGLFKSVGVGEEVVKNARIFVADLWRYNKEEETGTRFAAVNPDPNYGLIGLDFFRSHHVLISNTQHKLFITYEGGPICLPPPAKPQGAGQAGPP